jgi:thioredoxin 1
MLRRNVVSPIYSRILQIVGGYFTDNVFFMAGALLARQSNQAVRSSADSGMLVETRQLAWRNSRIHCAPALPSCFPIPHPLFLFIMSESIKHVSDASFDADVLKSDIPVLVDYWAAWCGPCKMIAPLLDEAAKQYEGRVIIAKVNVDDNPETAAKFGIRGIPTLMLFKDGKAAATKVGALSKSQLSAFLDESL